MAPVSRLSSSLTWRSLGRPRQTPRGIAPERRLWLRSSSVSSGKQRPSQRGIGPERRPPSRSSSRRCEKAHSASKESSSPSTFKSERWTFVTAVRRGVRRAVVLAEREQGALRRGEGAARDVVPRAPRVGRARGGPHGSSRQVSGGSRGRGSARQGGQLTNLRGTCAPRPGRGRGTAPTRRDETEHRECGGATRRARGGCGARRRSARREPRAEGSEFQYPEGTRVDGDGGKTPAKAQSATREAAAGRLGRAGGAKADEGEDAITEDAKTRRVRGFLTRRFQHTTFPKALSTIVTVNRCCARLGSTRREALVGLGSDSARWTMLRQQFATLRARGPSRRAIESKPPPHPSRSLRSRWYRAWTRASARCCRS